MSVEDSGNTENEESLSGDFDRILDLIDKQAKSDDDGAFLRTLAYVRGEGPIQNESSWNDEGDFAQILDLVQKQCKSNNDGDFLRVLDYVRGEERKKSSWIDEGGFAGIPDFIRSQSRWNDGGAFLRTLAYVRGEGPNHVSGASSSTPGGASSSTPGPRQADDDEDSEEVGDEEPEVFYVVDIAAVHRFLDELIQAEKKEDESLDKLEETLNRRLKLLSGLTEVSARSNAASFAAVKTGEETGYPEPRKLSYTGNDELDQLSKRCLELNAHQALVAPAIPEYTEVDVAVPLKTSGGVFIAMVDRSKALRCDADSYQHPVNAARNASTMFLFKLIEVERGARSMPDEVRGAGVFSPSFRHLSHEEADLLVQKVIDSAPELREVRRLKEAGMFDLIRM